MSKCLQVWFKIWIPLLLLTGLGLAYYLITNWAGLTADTRFVAIFYMTMPLHCLEEWRLPGGFHYNYNVFQKSETPDRYPMNQLSDMITIVLAEVMGILCLVFGVNEWIVMWTLTFCLLEMFGHLTFGFSMYKRFKSVGKKTIYNPGFVTAVCFTLNALVYIVTYFVGHLPSLTTIIFGILLGIVAVGGVALIPEKLLGDKESPYPFPSYRYYDKFLTAEKNRA